MARPRDHQVFQNGIAERWLTASVLLRGNDRRGGVAPVGAVAAGRVPLLDPGMPLRHSGFRPECAAGPYGQNGPPVCGRQEAG